jgi:hypothetical protein
MLLSSLNQQGVGYEYATSHIESDGEANMSRYAHAYQGAEPNISFTDLFNYRSMMAGKRDIEQLGANLLAEYRARRKS